MNKKRVEAICSMFVEGSTFLDIGTDHAFIPIFLLKNKHAINGFATEIHQGPFENAIKNIKYHNLDHRMEVKLGNGIEPFKHLQSVDYLIITGLGTSTIIDIIENSKNKFWDRMILESTNDVVKLRKWVKKNNYYIEDEILIKESNKYNFILRINNNRKTNVK
ncbi:MAG: SAM-dependent methyltransferase [Mycoplasmataceae bacterium]|nr:SAM-dependent methyltransferase [Mycoplasmataceae bacterium]